LLDSRSAGSLLTHHFSSLNPNACPRHAEFAAATLHSPSPGRWKKPRTYKRSPRYTAEPPGLGPIFAESVKDHYTSLAFLLSVVNRFRGFCPLLKPGSAHLLRLFPVCLSGCRSSIWDTSEKRTSHSMPWGNPGRPWPPPWGLAREPVRGPTASGPKTQPRPRP